MSYVGRPATDGVAGRLPSPLPHTGLTVTDVAGATLHADTRQDVPSVFPPVVRVVADTPDTPVGVGETIPLVLATVVSRLGQHVLALSDIFGTVRPKTAEIAPEDEVRRTPIRRRPRYGASGVDGETDGPPTLGRPLGQAANARAIPKTEHHSAGETTPVNDVT